jgi:hypothetical protein
MICIPQRNIVTYLSNMQIAKWYLEREEFRTAAIGFQLSPQFTP